MQLYVSSVGRGEAKGATQDEDIRKVGGGQVSGTVRRKADIIHRTCDIRYHILKEAHNNGTPSVKRRAEARSVSMTNPSLL